MCIRDRQEAVRLGYDVNDKVKVGFTYRRLDSYFEYPTPDVYKRQVLLLLLPFMGISLLTMMRLK